MAKRVFDIILAIGCIVILFPIIIGSWLLAGADTASNGFFQQQRVGRFGKTFTIYKLRTMQVNTTKVSKIGAVLRKFKLDELPQLVNILKGDMSFVGPRPDVPGYYDVLQGEERKVLKLRPGITSEAAIKYADEEMVLAQQSNPKEYNDSVLFPDKVQMNLAYYYKHSIVVDVKILLKTLRVLL